jgi:biopolymer transport protein ExbB/TolQ
MIVWLITAAILTTQLKINFLPQIGSLLTRPDFQDNIPPILILALFAWVLFEIRVKQKQVRREHAAVGEFQSVLDKADADQYRPKAFDLGEPRALRRADLIIECTRRGDASSLHEAVPAAAALDASTLAASYTSLQVYAWILPVLGFIGTASGMASSIGGFRNALRGSGQGQVETLAAELGQKVIPGLAGAFETTILALAAAVVAYLCATALRSWDQEALDQLDRLCIVLLSRIPQPPTPDGEKILDVLRQIDGQLRAVLYVPAMIDRSAKAISDTAEALTSSSIKFDSAVSTIGVAAEALGAASRQSESAATALKTAAESLSPGANRAGSEAPAKSSVADELAAVLRSLQNTMVGMQDTMKGMKETLEEPVTVILKRGQSE